MCVCVCSLQWLRRESLLLVTVQWEILWRSFGIFRPSTDSSTDGLFRQIINDADLH